MIADLFVPVAETVMGIDASTKSVAFGVFSDGKCIDYGKIDITSQNVEDACGEANKAILGLIDTHNPEFVVIEQAVYVRNVKVAIMLGNVFGAIIGPIRAAGIECGQATPVEWLKHIGNNVRSDKATLALMAEETPGKTRAWYKNKIREERKLATIGWVSNEHGISVDDDDIADAIAIGDFGYNVLSRRN